MADLLTLEERDAMMTTLSSWVLSDDAKSIHKTFIFKSFNAAMGFMMRAGLKAEVLNHHPEWFNVYNRVEVKLTTHDKDGLTMLDQKLASFMDVIAQSSGLKER